MFLFEPLTFFKTPTANDAIFAERGDCTWFLKPSVTFLNDNWSFSLALLSSSSYVPARMRHCMVQPRDRHAEHKVTLHKMETKFWREGHWTTHEEGVRVIVACAVFKSCLYSPSSYH